MSENVVTYYSIDRVAVITLNRPDRRNAIDTRMAAELAAAWRRFAASQDRVAVLAAAGDTFTVGADLDDSPHDLFRCMPGLGVALEKPVVAAVAGRCIGAGTVLVQMCDLAVAADTTTFLYPEAKVGFSGGLIASLAARIPHKVALELMLLGEPLSVGRAYEVGFVNKVVPAGQHLDAALEYARTLAVNAPMVLALLKRLAGQVTPKGPAELAGIARRELDALIGSDDFAEGRAAAREKRKAVFGRMRWDIDYAI